MLLLLEELLIQRNFHELVNTDETFIYSHKLYPMKQVAIIKDKNYGGWTFSFPLKNSAYNYKLRFNNFQDSKKYITDRITNLT
tara:strand:- start:56 stop:304 length:249 start_codon:yes stop_codon:yes gene_type:complete